MPKNGGGKGGGGDGPLSLNGNRKDNILIGGSHGDNIWGRDGNDILIGNGGGDSTADPPTIDLLVGGDGDDILVGDFATVDADGNVVLGDMSGDPDGVEGPDHLFGGYGNDSLYGGGGDDELQGGPDHDYLDGGDGFDLALYSADDYSIEVTVLPDGDGDGYSDGFNVEFRQVTLGNGDLGPAPILDEQALNIEGIVGTYYDDEMTGADIAERDPASLSPDGFVNIFDGYYGDDTLTGGDGSDCIFGGGDNDSIYGLAGDDLLFGGSGDDIIVTGAGDDTVDGGSNGSFGYPDHDVVTYDAEVGGIDLTSAIVPDADNPSIEFNVYTVVAPGGTDVIWNVEEVVGTGFADTMTGNAVGGDDHFTGGGGNDELYGMAGNDLLDGGNGGDTLDGGADTDTVSYANSNAAVDVDLGAGTATGGDATGDTLIDIENVIGSDFGDTLTGDGEANSLSGGEGNDTISGGGNSGAIGVVDVLDGGDGDDLLIGSALGAGRDAFRFGADWGDDTVQGFEDGTDVLYFFGSGLTFADLSIVDAGADALITQGSNSITLENVDHTLITEDDFLF